MMTTYHSIHDKPINQTLHIIHLYILKNDMILSIILPCKIHQYDTLLKIYDDFMYDKAGLVSIGQTNVESIHMWNALLQHFKTSWYHLDNKLLDKTRW